MQYPASPHSGLLYVCVIYGCTRGVASTTICQTRLIYLSMSTLGSLYILTFTWNVGVEPITSYILYRLYKKNPSVQSPCNPRRTLQGFSWGCTEWFLLKNLYCTEWFLLKNLYCLSERLVNRLQGGRGSGTSLYKLPQHKLWRVCVPCIRYALHRWEV